MELKLVLLRLMLKQIRRRRQSGRIFNGGRRNSVGVAQIYSENDDAV